MLIVKSHKNSLIILVASKQLVLNVIKCLVILIVGFSQPGIRAMRYLSTGQQVEYAEEGKSMTIECLHILYLSPALTNFTIYNGTTPHKCSLWANYRGEWRIVL